LNTLRKEEEFDKLMTASVFDTIRGVFGSTAAEALTFHLELSEDRRVPSDLQSRLVGVLGGGSEVIEKLIVTNLSKTLGLRIEQGKESSFDSAIKIMRREFVG
jgi:hypothetical protein